MFWDVLLRFHDPQLEAAFWAQRKDTFCKLDQFVTLLVFLNNAAVTWQAASIMQGGSLSATTLGPSAVTHRFGLGFVMYGSIQAAVCWAARYRRDAYFARRDTIMTAQRMLRVIAATYMSVFIAGPAEEQYTYAALLQH